MKNLREKLGLIQQISGKTQTELAEIFGVTFSAYNNWYNEKSIPRKSKLEKINNYGAKLGLTFSDSIKTEKEKFVDKLQKERGGYLYKILSRVDIQDELSLQITYHTNNIEGSTMTIDDTANILFHKKTLSNRTLSEQLEAKNHDIAFRYMLEFVGKNMEISSDFLKELHKILMSGIIHNAGSYRTHPVRIVGSFVPTANYLKITELVENLFSEYPKKPNLKTIFKFHADLEKIHPFPDGNGRVGRLILLAMLLQSGFPPAIIKGKVKNKYYKSLQNAQLKGEYDDLNDFLADAIIFGFQIVKD